MCYVPCMAKKKLDVRGRAWSEAHRGRQRSARRQRTVQYECIVAAAQSKYDSKIAAARSTYDRILIDATLERNQTIATATTTYDRAKDE
jgi:hypothetical protein